MNGQYLGTTSDVQPTPRDSGLRFVPRDVDAFALLRELDFLRGLADAVVDDFLARVVVDHYEPEAVVFRENEAETYVRLVVTGRVKIITRTEDNRDNIAAIPGPGELIGVIPLFGVMTNAYSAIALTETIVARVTAADLRVWLEQDVEAGMRFTRLLVRRVHDMHTLIDDFYGVDVAARVARAILRNARRFGRDTTLGRQIDIGLTQEGLASHVRASRERVNRVLTTWTRLGWILLEGTEISILNTAALQHQAGFDNEPSSV